MLNIKMFCSWNPLQSNAYFYKFSILHYTVYIITHFGHIILLRHNPPNIRHGLFIPFPNGLNHQIAHGEDNGGRAGRIDSSTQRQEKPSLTAPTQIVPKPTCGTQQDLLFGRMVEPFDRGVGRKEDVAVVGEGEVDLDSWIGRGGGGTDLTASD